MIQLPPLEESRLTHPDDLTLGDLFAIRAATGVDVQAPESTAEQITALLWFELKKRDPNVTWSSLMDLNVKALEPWWGDLTARGQQRALQELQQAQDADDAAAAAEQAQALRDPIEPDPEPVAPPVDPTSPADTGRRT